MRLRARMCILVWDPRQWGSAVCATGRTLCYWSMWSGRIDRAPRLLCGVVRFSHTSNGEVNSECPYWLQEPSLLLGAASGQSKQEKCRGRLDIGSVSVDVRSLVRAAATHQGPNTDAREPGGDAQWPLGEGLPGRDRSTRRGPRGGGVRSRCELGFRGSLPRALSAPCQPGGLR